jgi:hypothetical protein
MIELLKYLTYYSKNCALANPTYIIYASAYQANCENYEIDYELLLYCISHFSL